MIQARIQRVVRRNRPLTTSVPKRFPWLGEGYPAPSVLSPVILKSALSDNQHLVLLRLRFYSNLKRVHAIDLMPKKWYADCL